MSTMRLLFGFLLATLMADRSIAGYTLRRDHSGNHFTEAFEFRVASDFKQGDPTHGFVNYIDEATARSKGMAMVTNRQVYLGADSTTVVPTSAQGRDSIRLEAKESFTHGLMLADIAHMPGNVCGIWPAFWTFNFDEDPYGEIDIIEGVSDWQLTNTVSLHTCGSCNFGFSDTSRRNCSIGNERDKCAETGGTAMNYGGCGASGSTNSYGTRFNQPGGGVYATEITKNSVKIWYFPRTSIPDDIKSGHPNPAHWPAPITNAEEGQMGCDVTKYFKKQTMIINIDFCGSNIPQSDWDRDTICKAKAATCQEYVGNNPSAFSEAYWLFNSIKLDQQ